MREACVVSDVSEFKGEVLFCHVSISEYLVSKHLKILQDLSIWCFRVDSSCIYLNAKIYLFISFFVIYLMMSSVARTVSIVSIK
jgi:hypothetical protein